MSSACPFLSNEKQKSESCAIPCEPLSCDRLTIAPSSCPLSELARLLKWDTNIRCMFCSWTRVLSRVIILSIALLSLSPAMADTIIVKWSSIINLQSSPLAKYCTLDMMLSISVEPKWSHILILFVPRVASHAARFSSIVDSQNGRCNGLFACTDIIPLVVRSIDSSRNKQPTECPLVLIMW